MKALSVGYLAILCHHYWPGLQCTEVVCFLFCRISCLEEMLPKVPAASQVSSIKQNVESLCKEQSQHKVEGNKNWKTINCGQHKQDSVTIGTDTSRNTAVALKNSCTQQKENKDLLSHMTIPQV